MEQIVAEVKAQYEEIAARSREEAEAWYRSRVRTGSGWSHSSVQHCKGYYGFAIKQIQAIFVNIKSF